MPNVPAEINAPPAMQRLVDRFREQELAYRSSVYNETQLRREFADPLFEALGWDLTNAQGLSEAYKDVVQEDRLIVGGASRAPDYSFRIGGERKFFVETKRPSVNLRADPAPAFQLRRYAWSAKLPLSILTDFEEFAVYDCRQEPTKDDGAATARLLFLTCDEFPTRWTEISDLFARDAVLAGSLEAYAQSIRVRRGTSEVDNAFLREIEGWRAALAEDVAERNPSITQRDLNFVVQQTIDRIIFLRIAEDRGLEPYGQLREGLTGDGIYARLVGLFRRADARYNAGLFHFSDEPDREEGPDRLTPTVLMGDTGLRRILSRLYYPDSPYEFSVLPARILGQVYEQFLGKVIRLTSGHEAVVEDKPEVKKAGGVYYTPTPIVDYIVRVAVAPIVEGKTPRQVGGEGKRPPVRILDAACGSGSFLLGAFEFLLQWYLDSYLTSGADKWTKGRSPRLRQTENGEYRLTVSERKRILLAHIYGVDIDLQAVEVTKLSLLLKVLEGESGESVFPQMELLQERALPDLGRNVRCGNSLIAPDIYEQQLDLLDQERRFSINAFDWTREFAAVFRTSDGFDAVIGNPPYIDSELMTQVMPEWRTYCVEHYEAASGNWDLFCVFVERALALCRPGGTHSFIVPNKLGSAGYAAGARRVLVEDNDLTLVRDYSSVPVFPVSVYPIVYVAERTRRRADLDVTLERMEETSTRLVRVTHAQTLEKARYFRGSNPWPIFSDLAAESPVERLRDDFSKLSQHASVWGAATVAEAYEIAPLIEEAGGEPLPRDLVFVNSGTIDRYVMLWGRKRLRYLRRVYERPVISRVSELPSTRAQQAQSPKIIVAGMTKVLECAADLEGRVLAGKSTSIIVTGLDIRLLLGILNSRVVSFFYNAEYGGNRLQGGYLRIGPPQLRNIPIPPLDIADYSDRQRQGAVVGLVDEMLELHESFARARTPGDQETLRRLLDAKDRQIDRVVYALYGLSDIEVAVIEHSMSSEQSSAVSG